MDIRTITYEQPDDPVPETYRRLDSEVETLRDLSLLGGVLVAIMLFLVVSFVSSFIYYRTGAHGKMRSFILSIQSETKK